MSKNLEVLRLFISKLINDEQDAHSKLLKDLDLRISNTSEYDQTSKILTKIFEAKVEVLEKVLKKVQEL